ncbi:MAG TPA: DNA-3-methyladenine glycosylase [Burkholderiales bacterium]
MAPISLPATLTPLPRVFYDRPAIEVAPDLLGKLLVREHEGRRQVGRIVEVEAYLGPHDLAAHSARGRTQRTEVMFGPPGYAYVYMIYGIHYCMNVVTEPAGVASAVLLRAIEPLQNIDTRTQGPGLLCKAMGIDKRLHGHDMLSEDFFLAELPAPPRITVVRRPRIGVDYAGHWARRLLRFYVKGNPWISRP